MDSYERTAQIVRQLRQESRLSQRELASLAGTSGPTIAAYEAGTKEPRLSTLDRIGAAAGRTLDVRIGAETAGDRQRARRETRSIAVAAAVASAVQRDFPKAVEIARANLDRTRDSVADNKASRWLSAWEQALSDGPAAVRTVLLDRSEHGHDMRQMSPLSGLISDAERLAALAAAEAVHP